MCASQEYTSVNAKNLGKEFLRVGICTKHINNFSRMLPDTKAAEDPQAGMFTKNGRLPYRAKFSDWMAARRSQKTQTSFQIDFVVAVSCNFIVSLSVIPIEKNRTQLFRVRYFFYLFINCFRSNYRAISVPGKSKPEKTGAGNGTRPVL